MRIPDRQSLTIAALHCVEWGSIFFLYASLLLLMRFYFPATRHMLWPSLVLGGACGYANFHVRQWARAHIARTRGAVR
ncbi:hypothetical protein [Amantichitinum ursilacus]|uniref:Uncharacterized protein n=1 Tax=Amantichitinum ursilacus TaxID=857265 RepID=A0A0N1JS96_9NEIS|nr:hypothetical protein [Amantichitinum ursilacus]KPC50672.1 hypothetical protein WG78_16500 [Amantichitinum ursilacus]